MDVQIACHESDVPSARQIRSWVTRAVAGSGRKIAANAEISVRLVDREEIRLLNRDYRQLDKTTNVLSFPAGEISGLPAEAAQLLGDVVVCAAVVRDEATTQGKSEDEHWAHMLVHGTLHLLGYDHETAAEAAEMEALEASILAANGLTDPYLTSP
ncbi:MAG: rRNA maturation RNase YbeY [Gammaproteobacteria bacterium]|nr:rRNA maturation RNase YbeY [Gammaproteobacteria bacterium]MBT8109411.1 rRNA maturation RNase YbeY [Gammaproteobacteria bacterium]